MTLVELDVIRATVVAALQRHLRDGAAPDRFPGDDADLVEHGLVESLRLLDILLEVESASGREMDPDRLELGGGITVRKLVAAFAPA